MAIAGALAAARLSLAVVDPRLIREFGRATERLATTDRLDAEAIALSENRETGAPSAAECRHALGELITSESGRRDPRLWRRLEAHVSWLQKELSALEADLDNAICGTPGWRVAENLLATVPGIAKTSARSLIAELPELGSLGRGRIAALVGVAPINRDSGSFRGRRVVMGGRAHVRTALSIPTSTAIRHDPALQTFYQRLIGRGRPAKVAITVCMFKLLVIQGHPSRSPTIAKPPWQSRCPLSCIAASQSRIERLTAASSGSR